MGANYWHDLKRDSIREQAHQAVVIGYDTAIANYKRGKDQLLKQLNIEKGEAEKAFLERINAVVVAELENENWDQEIDKYFTNIQNVLTKYVDVGSVSFQDLVNKCEAQTKEHSQTRKNYYNRLKAELENFLNSQNLTKSILQQLAGLSNKKTKEFSYYYGYLRQSLLSMATGGEGQYNFKVKENDYKKSLKGELKEQMVAEALSKIMKNYGARVKQTGSQKNDKGQEINQDIILFSKNQRVLRSSEQPFKNIIKRMENLAQQNEVVVEDKWAFGVQSKSWNFPAEDALFKPGDWLNMPFGGYAAGMPEGDSAHYWHAGVQNVMEHIEDIIGYGTVLYSLGNETCWTCDLLAKLREKQLVLAYYWNKTEEKLVSSEVAAYYHQDD